MLDLAWPIARPLLFRLDAERAHELTLSGLARFGGPLGALARLTMGSPEARLARQVGGVRVAGPIGLAAGLDKNGVAIPFWPKLGFGFVEVGTVTAHPQPGNPRPRLHRLVDEGALINAMGFNNEGSEALAGRLARLREQGAWPDVPVGANLGKSKVTPLEDAPSDYATSARRLARLVDWLTINVSSPNTPGLRSLQDAEALRGVLGAVLAEAGDTPVWLKLAPDLTEEALSEAVELAVGLGVAGVVATNTTLRRDGLARDPGLAGGLSGRPLWPVARPAITAVLRASGGRIPVIGVGGVHRPEQARDLLDAGCAAVQLYTGLIFEGPGLVKRLNQAL